MIVKVRGKQMKLRGVGDFLALDLKRLWIKEKAGCGCKSFQQRLNQLGPAGCRNEFEKILDELEQKAHKFGYPFVRMAAGWLLSRAIKNADSELNLWRKEVRGQSFQERHGLFPRT